MAFSLFLDGIDDYLSSNQVTLDRVVMDFSYELNPSSTTAFYLFDARNGTPAGNFMVYISSGYRLSLGNGVKSLKVNGAVVPYLMITPDTRYMIEATFSSVVATDANGIQFGVNYINQNVSRFKGTLYRITGYKGNTVQFDYNMALGNVLDQSGNGNNATLVGGTWLSSAPVVPTPPSGTYGYTIEPALWGISTDFTNADATIDGMNHALLWAYNNGFNEIMLPKGNYLLNVVGKSLAIQSNTILDLGGSTLKAAPNNAPKYTVISADAKKYATIRNGIIQGDRYEHDYSADTPSGTSTHEWGVGVVISGLSQFITVENMEIYETTGDGIDTQGNYNQLAVVYRNQFESGFINTTTGQLETNKDWIRSNVNFSLTYPLILQNKFFGFYGNGYGQLSFNGLQYYNAYYYKSDGTFISVEINLPFFDPIAVVDDAAFVRIAVKTTLPDASFDRLAEFRCHEQPSHITIRCNHIHDTRRCAMALGEGRFITVEDNIIHDIHGTAPQCGIDVEDGYLINQNYLIRRNQFYNNLLYDLILYSGKYMTVEDNLFSSTCTNNAKVEQAQWRGNKFDQTRLLVSGECIVSHNYFNGSYIQLAGTGKKQINHSMFNNSYVDFVEEQPYLSTVASCKFYVDPNQSLFQSFITRILFRGFPATISDCDITGLDILDATTALPGLQNGFVFNRVVFRGVKNVGLPCGEYTDCQFIDTPMMTKIGPARGDLVFKNCQMKMTTQGFLITNIRNLRILDSEIYISSTCDYALSLNDIDTVDIKGTLFYGESLTHFPTASLLKATEQFKGSQLIIDGNRFSHNNGTQLLAAGISTVAVTAPVKALALNNILTYCRLNLRPTDVRYDNIVDGIME